MITTRGSKWQLEGRFYSLRASYAYLLDKQCTWSWFICHPHEGHKPWEDLGLSRSHQPHHQDHPKGIQNVCVLIRHHRTTLKQPAYNSVNICNNTTKQVLVLAPLDTQRPWWEVSYLLKVKHQKKRQKVSRGCSYLLCQRTSSCHSFFSCLTMKNNKNKSKNFKCTKFFLKKCNYLVEKQTHTQSSQRLPWSSAVHSGWGWATTTAGGTQSWSYMFAAGTKLLQPLLLAPGVWTGRNWNRELNRVCT